MESIQRWVAEFYGVSVNDLKAMKRNKNIVLPRQVAMYLVREMTNLSFPEIGVGFGGKDHTTVLYSWNKIREGLSKDVVLKNSLDRIIDSIK